MPGGMSVVFGTILRELFADGPMLDVGFELNRPGKTIRLFIRLGLFIMDGLAHKSVCHCKGDMGSKCCVVCRNVFSAVSEIADEDDGSQLFRCNVTKYSELDLA